MGDMGDVFREMQQMKKERHQKWFDKNMEIIMKSNLDFHSNGDTCILFRKYNGPKVDFYPHTGRWKFQNKYYSGGAEKFLKWYRKKQESMSEL